MLKQIKCTFCQLEQQPNETFLRFRPNELLTAKYFCISCETKVGGKFIAQELVEEVFGKKTKTLEDYNFLGLEK